ncbi:hypothetical protein [Maridesulfovibrio sp. FT414]|uniref:hypothetical protein n=1 Tax=Maridesulfovibrio sp. FT414 TaxID=2979469 RepID=UPI003D8038FB
MTGIGINEILLVLIILGATILPFWLGLRLRKTRPDVLWIGIVLTMLFGPLGQVYVEGWIPWFLILLGVCIAAQQLLPPEAAMLIMIVSSPLVLFFRMRR